MAFSSPSFFGRGGEGEREREGRVREGEGGEVRRQDEGMCITRTRKKHPFATDSLCAEEGVVSIGLGYEGELGRNHADGVRLNASCKALPPLSSRQGEVGEGHEILLVLLAIHIWIRLALDLNSSVVLENLDSWMGERSLIPVENSLIILHYNSTTL